MNTIHLFSANTSVVILSTPAPQILYWGQRLNHLDETLSLLTERAVSQARLDIDIPITLCPESGRGLFSSAGLEGFRTSTDGRNLDWAPVFETTEVESNNSSARFVCVDDIAKLELSVVLQLDKSGVLRKSLSIKNLAPDPYHLNRLVNTLPLPHRANEVMSFHGRWSREFQTQRVSIDHGAFSQDNRRGRTSHEYFPGMMVGNKGFSEQTGEVWGFHLAWSGNNHLRCETKSDGRRFAQLGELLIAGEVSLGKDERYSTPELYACYSDMGLNGIRSQFHDVVRSKILAFPNKTLRPVHLNTWEGIYFEHDPDYIKQMATEAAKIGVERFIIDDGWFIGRDGERAALGDWFLDKKKYPNGLEPVIEHVNQLGMEFGLWVEPEMVNPDSNLFRKHPDWMLGIDGYDQPSGRYQYLLDLQNNDCFTYLFNCLDALLTDYNIGYFKWDMNRELVQPAHEGVPAASGQTKAFYRLIDELSKRHPTVEIESCSSGGGRIDFEVLKRTHRFWTSDCNDALERQTIQKGMSYFFPPEVMGAHIGPYESHTTRRRHDINLRGITALGGHMGVELDPVKESEEEKSLFAHYIELHKRFRSLLHSGEVFYLDSVDTTRNVYGVKNTDEMLLTVCQLTMPDYANAEPIRFAYLETEKQYLVEVVDFPQASKKLNKVMPSWMDKPLVLSGELLNKIGLTMPIQDPETAMLISIKAV
ncbi:alpha-galactosidase [Vibrio sp. VB16]|uniref:alpha-galactosidase n=1 Tax=Vibrio sp. VB16 TaxID=2785746 RepID=UPI00189E89AF|nr:alpha-galactosidase [Vibrio sp. VB16]UGA54205.1 alpha-galactosidase [Vibrio sp. VB16]